MREGKRLPVEFFCKLDPCYCDVCFLYTNGTCVLRVRGKKIVGVSKYKEEQGEYMVGG